MWLVNQNFVFVVYKHFSPSPSFIFQCSPIFWSRSNQINYLWYTTCKNCLKFFWSRLWYNENVNFFGMSIRSCFSCNCWLLNTETITKRNQKIKVDGNFFTLFIFLSKRQFFCVFCYRWMRKIIVKGDLKTKRISSKPYMILKFVCFHLKFKTNFLRLRNLK